MTTLKLIELCRPICRIGFTTPVGSEKWKAARQQKEKPQEWFRRAA